MDTAEIRGVYKYLVVIVSSTFLPLP